MYGDETLQLPNGAQPLRDVLDPLQAEEFDSAEEVRQVVIGLSTRKQSGENATATEHRQHSVKMRNTLPTPSNLHLLVYGRRSMN